MPTTSFQQLASDHSLRISFTHFKTGDSGEEDLGHSHSTSPGLHHGLGIHSLINPEHRVSCSIATTQMGTFPRWSWWEGVSASSFKASMTNITGTMGPPRTDSRSVPKFCLVLSQGLHYSHFHTCRPPCTFQPMICTLQQCQGFLARETEVFLDTDIGNLPKYHQG